MINMTKPRQPKSIVVNYDHANKELTFQTVEDATLKSLLTGTTYPILLDDFGGKIDDEFARRFGVAILNCLALFKPELKALMFVTEQSIAAPDRPPPATPGDCETIDYGVWRHSVAARAVGRYKHGSDRSCSGFRREAPPKLVGATPA